MNELSKINGGGGLNPYDLPPHEHDFKSNKNREISSEQECTILETHFYTNYLFLLLHYKTPS